MSELNGKRQPRAYAGRPWRRARRLVALVPIRPLRLRLLRLIPGIHIGPDCSIGFGTVIDVDRFELGAGSSIGRNNKFMGPITVRFGEKVVYGDKNEMGAGEWVTEAQFAGHGYRRSVVFGDRCLVTDGHHFDVAGGIVVGEGTWIAGRGSQFWTHGVGIVERDVSIGSECYIGTGVLLAPGSRLGDRNIVSLGSVLTKDLHDVEGQLIGGAPATPLKSIDEDFDNGRLDRFSL